MNSEYITQPISAKLSASLLKACQEAGIPEPGFVTQDLNGVVYAYTHTPRRTSGYWIGYKGRFCMLPHKPFTSNWKDLLVFVKHPTLADVTAAHTIDEYDQ